MSLNDPIVLQVLSRQALISESLNNGVNKEFYFTYKPNQWPLQQQAHSSCRLLILDSSFNPPTKAHVDLVQKSIRAYPDNYFDGLLLLFSTNNVDKKITGASVLQRVQMMEIVALQQLSLQPRVPAAVGLTPHGRFIDKATAIRSWFVNQSHKNDGTPLELYFIVGFDTMIRLLDPKYYHPIPVKEAVAPFFHHCQLICADRGQADTSFWEKVNEEYGQKLIKRIQLDPSISSLSSTLARTTLSTSHNSDNSSTPIEDILDRSIINYINQCENHIY